MQITQRYILQIYEVRREAYETVCHSFRPCTPSGWENERTAKGRKRRKRDRNRETGGGEKNKSREWSAVWKYKVGCKDCEFWGFCSFASLSSVLAYEKIHRLNGLVYYFLYSGRSFCESPAKKSATFHPLPLVSSAFSLSSDVSSPSYSLSDVHQSKNAPCNLHVEVFYVSQVSYSHFSLERLIINSCV